MSGLTARTAEKERRERSRWFTGETSQCRYRVRSGVRKSESVDCGTAFATRALIDILLARHWRHRKLTWNGDDLLGSLPSDIRPRRHAPPCWLSLGYNLRGAFRRATRIARLPPAQPVVVDVGVSHYLCVQTMSNSHRCLSQSKCQPPSDSWLCRM